MFADEITEPLRARPWSAHQVFVEDERLSDDGTPVNVLEDANLSQSAALGPSHQVQHQMEC
ncbi:MAG: hypothetical protein E6581_01795, partial [Cutibacterium granulosum]|nr:hypothetical protein [Cutibacterium granulosum]